MTDNMGRRFLAALQLADSFFPSGMYAHSQGLESMASRRLVTGADDVERYLRNLLVWSVLPSDGVALLNANGAALGNDVTTVVDIDWHLQAMKLPEEMRMASCHAGRRVLDESVPLTFDSDGAAPCTVYRRMVVGGDAPGTGAVALGVVSAAVGIERESALLMFCHSFAVGVLGAAQRLLPLTHSQAQMILRRLHEPVTELADDLSGRPWHGMTSFTPQADIASMLHEHDDIRMFAS